MFKKIITFFLICFFLITPVLAQETTVELTSEPIVETSNYELEGIEVDNIIEVPSALGFWWRGIKEDISLALTFNPVKKAEKALKYAEERMQIAEKISDLGENIKNQERMQKNIEKAQKFMEKVEFKKEKWLEDKNQEKVQNLVQKLADYQIKRELIFDKLEEKIPEESENKVLEWRKKGLETSQSLIQAIDNENISEDVKEHLQNVKARIELHVIEVDDYQKAKEELKQRVQVGSQEMKEGLKFLNEQRKEKLKVHLEEVKK